MHQRFPADNHHLSGKLDDDEYDERADDDHDHDDERADDHDDVRADDHDDARPAVLGGLHLGLVPGGVDTVEWWLLARVPVPEADRGRGGLPDRDDLVRTDRHDRDDGPAVHRIVHVAVHRHGLDVHRRRVFGDRLLLLSGPDDRRERVREHDHDRLLVPVDDRSPDHDDGEPVLPDDEHDHDDEHHDHDDAGPVFRDVQVAVERYGLGDRLVGKLHELFVCEAAVRRHERLRDVVRALQDDDHHDHDDDHHHVHDEQHDDPDPVRRLLLVPDRRRLDALRQRLWRHLRVRLAAAVEGDGRRHRPDRLCRADDDDQHDDQYDHDAVSDDDHAGAGDVRHVRLEDGAGQLRPVGDGLRRLHRWVRVRQSPGRPADERAVCLQQLDHLHGNDELRRRPDDDHDHDYDHDHDDHNDDDHDHDD